MKSEMGWPSRRTPASFIGLFLLAGASPAFAGTWGLLASPGYENQPVKAVYFFPGDLKPDALSTSISDKRQRDNNWNDTSPVGLAARNQIVAEIGALRANVIFAVYNGPYSDVHFVNNTEASFLAVFFASNLINGPLVVPSLEDVEQGIFVVQVEITPLVLVLIGLHRVGE